MRCRARGGVVAWMVAAAMALGLYGCGSARILYQDRDGGTLILEGDEDKAMEAAQEEMAAHCAPGAYEITRRELVTVGTERYVEERTDYDEDERRARDVDVDDTRRGERVQEDEASERRGSSTTTAVSGVREVRERRITYVCN